MTSPHEHDHDHGQAPTEQQVRDLSHKQAFLMERIAAVTDEAASYFVALQRCLGELDQARQQIGQLQEQVAVAERERLRLVEDNNILPVKETSSALPVAAS